MKTNQVKHLNEFLSIPTGLELIADIDNFPLYTSDSLKEKFDKELSVNPITKNNSDLLSRLISNDKLIPCWTTKSIAGNVLQKIADSKNKIILGVFVPRFNKIFIIMTGNINMFGFTNNKLIANTTNRLCCRMAGFNSKVNFLNIWEKELTIYYTRFFRLLLNVKKEFEPQLSIIAKEFYTDTYNNFEHIVDITKDVKKNVKKNVETWEKIVIKHTSKIPFNKTNFKDEKSYNLAIDSIDHLGALGIYGLDVVISYYHFYEIAWRPLILAYKSLKISRDLKSIVYQELLYPSEVIAILSTYSVVDQSKLTRSLSLIK
jgi:hypothetical protein